MGGKSKITTRQVLATVSALLCLTALAVTGQRTGEPVVWGPILGAIGEEYVAVSWQMSRPVGIDLEYAMADVYDDTQQWEETLVFAPFEGVAEVRLGDLLPGTTYRYRLVVYEGDAVYRSPVGTFTTSGPNLRACSLLVYGDTWGDPERHRIVADAMASHEPGAVLLAHAGGLVEEAAPEAFSEFLQVLSRLAGSRPFVAVPGEAEHESALYFDLLSLPSGGGPGDESWWSFDYGEVHLVGIDSSLTLGDVDQTLAREQAEWVRADLAGTNARFKVVLLHHPIYSAAWEGGVNARLEEIWASVFEEAGVDLVFSGRSGGYEHLYVGGIHYVVTSGGGAPLAEAPEEIAAGTVARRYGLLHYVRVTIAGTMLRMEAIPVASFSEDGMLLVPSGRPIDAFTLIAGD